MYETQTYAASDLIYCSETGRSTLQDVHRCEFHHQLSGKSPTAYPFVTLRGTRALHAEVAAQKFWKPSFLNRSLQVMVCSPWERNGSVAALKSVIEAGACQRKFA